jgi:hypothetical protein
VERLRLTAGCIERAHVQPEGAFVEGVGRDGQLQLLRRLVGPTVLQQQGVPLLTSPTMALLETFDLQGDL